MIENTWKTVPLSQVLDKIIGGGTPSKSNVSYWGGNIPWASVKDMKNGQFSLFHTIDFITDEGVKKSATNIIPQGNVIISTRMGLGRCFINHIDCAINQDLKALIPNKLITKQYLLWWLVSQSKLIETIGHGTTVKGIRLEQLKKIPVSLPPLPVQQKIAGILSAYNDLIENNNRRINVLEEIAQKLYREWFIDFKFPNYQNVEFAKSEFGFIPKGWKVSLVKNLLDRKPAGIKYKEKSISVNGSVPVLDQSTSEILGYHNNNPDHIAQVTRPIIIFGDHTCKMQILIKPFSVSENVIPFVPKNEMPATFLFYLIRSLVNTKEYKRHWTELTSKTVLVPDFTLQKNYEHQVIPMIEMMDKLREVNSNLSRARNILLSKLISGELSVDNLEVKI